MRVAYVAIGATVWLTLIGCDDRELPTANSKLIDPNGGFTLFVSNQSFAIDPVDILVEIDGELVISDYFHVGTQHTFIPFTLSLSAGTHGVHIWSEKGDAEMTTEFELVERDVGVISYSYYPKSHYNPTPRQFTFHAQKGPLMIQ